MVAAGSITVAVRVRPPTSWESARLPEPCYDSTFRGDGALATPNRSVLNSSSLREVVQIVDDRILTFDPDEKDRARAFVERGFVPPGTKRYKDRRFMFDKVFNHESQQRDVYEATSQPLLKGLFEGYNATVFAYGATGCGKTHTISGTEGDPGIIYLTMADLFQRIEDRRDEWNVEVMVTFLEIYNEEIRDLLAEPGSHVPRGGLSIREDKTVKVAGLVELRPNSAEEVKAIVLQGNLRRTQSPTHANETSSRSHAVLQVHVTQSPRTAALSEARTMATLSIIDLAGSERAAATTNMGQRMVEGANINKSLLALGNCINALCESGGAIRHVPYRNSKLTRLLKFSLGGNCKTVMIVCVAPTSNHFDDTHNTLVYAERATKIKTKVVTRNVVNVDRHVGQYVEAINRLNGEIAELKAKLAGQNKSDNEITRRKRAEAAAEVDRAKKDIQAKVDQTKASIVDGAACTGKSSVAQIKLQIIKARLDEIGTNRLLSLDLQAEQDLLKALAEPEERILKPDSGLSIRLQKSANSRSMFEATMRAVSERRSEKWDDASLDSVKLTASCRKAEIERLKAEEERNVMRDAVEDMAQVIVSLVGMIGRSTVMVGEASRVLGDPPAGGDDMLQKLGRSLGTLRVKNDEALLQLVKHSTSQYSAATGPTDSLESFTGYDTTFSRRVSSGPAVLQRATTKRPSSTEPGSPRRTFRSPRKSLRSSLASQPYRKVSDKEKRGLKSAKNVQWRDEVGQGSLDDGGPKFEELEPKPVPSTSTSSTRTPPPRCTSLGGSESDWEDENEKTDDSVNLNLLSSSLPASTRPPSDVVATSLRSYGSLGAKRSRPSRLDPSFLKSKTRGSALGSLAEGNESLDEDTPPPRYVSQPLSDRLNQLPENSNDQRQTSSSSDRPRVPATPRTLAGKTRRRSNIGTMRNEKARRRSSLIPQLSPAYGEPGKPRRVMLGSPAKRSKGSRVSTRELSFSNLSALDPDASFNKSSRPTWR